MITVDFYAEIQIKPLRDFSVWLFMQLAGFVIWNIFLKKIYEPVWFSSIIYVHVTIVKMLKKKKSN